MTSPSLAAIGPRVRLKLARVKIKPLVPSQFCLLMYRVTIQVVANLPLTSKQKFHLSKRPMY